jgi:hypothetical protein
MPDFRLDLSYNHRSRLSVTLRLLDETLCAYRQWALGSEMHSVLYHEKNDLSGRQRRAILNVISKVSVLLYELKDVFELEEQIQEISRTIRGGSAGLWSSTVEMHSKYLKGYGAVPQETKEYLDPKIDELEKLMRNLSEIVIDSGERMLE